MIDRKIVTYMDIEKDRERHRRERKTDRGVGGRERQREYEERREYKGSLNRLK